MIHRIAATSIAVLLLLAATTRAEPELETRWIDVSDLTDERVDDAILPFGIPDPTDNARHETGPEPREFPALDADDIAGLVYGILGDDGRLLASGRDSILVRGRPDRVREAERRMRALGRARSWSTTLSIVWTEAKLERSGTRRKSGTVVADRGRRVALRCIEETTFVEDYDVEVAQAARIGDIDIGRIREGLEVYVRARPLSDGSPRIAIETFARAGRLRRPIKAIRTGSDQAGRLDLPVMEVMETHTVSLLPPGASLALPALGATGKVMLLVKRTDGTPISAPELTDPRHLLIRPDEIRFPLPDGRPRVEDPEDFTLGPRFRTDDSRPPKNLLPALRTAAALADSELRVIRLTLSVLDDEGTVRPALTLEALSGRLVCGRVGTMRNVLTEPDVETAKDGGQIEDPQVGQLFDGLTVNVRPTLVDEGRAVELDLDCALTRVDPKSLFPIREPGARIVGGFQQPRTEVDLVTGPRRLVPGRPLDVPLRRGLRLRILVGE